MKSRTGFLLICGFIAISFAYAAWMTGFTFAFRETDVFPNYNMLAAAFAKGQLFIDEMPPEDYSIMNGKRYLYFGPLPALIRLPAWLILGRGIPTGLMVVLFCAGSAVLFGLTINELTPVQESSDSLLKAVFIILFIFNGYSLLITLIPSIHHEAIAAAAFFLMLALNLLVKTWNRGNVPAPATAALIGLSLACSLASRATYAFSAGVIVIVFIAITWSRAGYVLNRKAIAPMATIVTIIVIAAGLLLAYNYLRFGDPLEFGMKYAESMFKNYLLAGNFVRYEHIPYNLWSLFFRLPITASTFPFLIMPEYILKTESIGFMPYSLMYENELSASIFVLMPVLILFVVPLALAKESKPGVTFRMHLVLFVLLVTQVLPISVSMATAARYYYDFLPIMMIMAYLGALWLKRKKAEYFFALLLMAVVSMIVSITLPMNAMSFYLGKFSLGG